MKRNTHQQQMVMEALNQFKGRHPTADQVYEWVLQAIPTISRATVYRILNQFTDAGGVQRVQISATADRYDDHLEHHYHMRCNHCGRITDVDMPILTDLPKRLTSTAGYEITGHDIVFTGLCTNCKGT